MPFAARVGDPTGHGTPLTPSSPPGGSVNVLIGGRPAWRAGTDAHVCPLVSGTVAHAGGVVAQGSTTVFVNGLPAARSGDRITEAAGPPNPIANGCPTVLIGG
ncbi:PAAR domain-containing protein [Streptomyces sp. Tu102]|uniref:PAAR domain-containing protein n=1 Tax=Streptomyces sp. Tu102 TaxID=2838019 RepID=UPI001BDBB420|nr:PAAR domain-containing protein [Streptomyces sp. Tu102]MBT1090319.1 PAAR domain-containing protein [Streptomyces sp. Tu102]